MAACQDDELDAAIVQQHVGTDYDRARLPRHDACKGYVDLAIATCIEDLDTAPDGRRSGLHTFDEGLGNCRDVWIEEHGERGNTG